MKKKWVAGCVLVLTISLSSCYSKLHLTEQPEFKEYSGQKGVWVMKVKTTDGDSVIFSRKYPGIIKDTAVISYPLQVDTILKSQVDSVRQNFNETRTSHFWLNGKKYAIKNEVGSTFTYSFQDSLYLPFNEIAEVEAIKFQKITSFLFTFTTISALVSLGILAAFSSMSSMFG